MTRQQLKELERSLSLLSSHIVKEKYRQVADRCRFLDLPTPRVMLLVFLHQHVRPVHQPLVGAIHPE
jgi:hypothetical protein